MTQQSATAIAPVDTAKNGKTNLLTDDVYQRYRKLLVKDSANGRIYSEEREKKVLKDSDIRIRKIAGKLFISPFFLMTSLSAMFWLPEELLQKMNSTLANKQFWQSVAKRIFDIVCAVMGFIFCSIFFFIIPFIIKFDSRGPAFYKQVRAGKNNREKDRRVVNLAVAHDRRKGDRRKEDLFGRPFWVYKFRTMTTDAEKHGAQWAKKNDPRITALGRILRFTHVDEIPQFYNVLLGEMSMVGPRPERPELMPPIIEKVADFPDRLMVKPGMTGIAQIVCGYDTTIEATREKLRYDMVYVRNQGIKADIMILLQTLWVIIRGKEVLDS